MSFFVSDQHIEEYFRDHVTVFRGLIPASLLRELRCESEKGRELAREAVPSIGQIADGNAQRLQPISAYDDLLSMQVFRDFLELDEFVTAAQVLLSTEHQILDVDWLGIFYEPGERHWCMRWHRDVITNTPLRNDPDGLQVALDLSRHALRGCQFNAALYQDACTWYVPASSGRPDIAAELQAEENMPEPSDDPLVNELRCAAYCRSMPGARQLVLEPGDVALYRHFIWHAGNYSPERKRATLHSQIRDPADENFFKFRRGNDFMADRIAKIRSWRLAQRQ